MANKQNIIVAILMVGTLMAAVDSTIVLLAFSDIVSGLHSNLVNILWVILIYLFITAVFMTQLGKIGDIYGRSRIFNLGFLTFTIGSALCGFAFSDVSLIAFRAIQAVGGAMITANSGAIIADTFEPNKRGRAYGFLALGWNMGATLGIVLGGLITTFLGWRYIFFINVPIGIVAFAFGLKYITNNAGQKRRLDYAGMALLTTLLMFVVYGAIDFVSESLTLFNAGLIAAGLILIPFFVAWEKHTDAPMLDFDAFKNRVLRFSITASFFQSLGYLSVLFMIIMYLQGVRGLTPLYASVILIPGYILSSFLAPIMGKFSDRFGSRALTTIGVALMVAAVMVYLSLSALTPDYVFLIIGASIMSGIGAAMFYPANNSAVMANAEKTAYGATSGLLRTMGSIGALMSFVLTISIAAFAIPRSVAFSIFIGTSHVIGNISSEFVVGLHAALLASLFVLFVAGMFSFLKGKEKRRAAVR